MKNKLSSKLAKMLNIMGIMEIFLFPLLFILMVWVDEITMLKKLLLSNFIAFMGTGLAYYFACYTTDKD